jgi:hypothetical protein
MYIFLENITILKEFVSCSKGLYVTVIECTQRGVVVDKVLFRNCSIEGLTLHQFRITLVVFHCVL